MIVQNKTNIKRSISDISQRKFKKQNKEKYENIRGKISIIKRQSLYEKCYVNWNLNLNDISIKLKINKNVRIEEIRKFITVTSSIKRIKKFKVSK